MRKGTYINNNKIQRTITEYFENLYSSKLEHLEVMNKFLDAYNQPKSNQEDINHLSRPITNNGIEAVIKSLTTKKSPGPHGFMGEFY
jgi:glutamyl-tRNA reductase